MATACGNSSDRYGPLADLLTSATALTPATGDSRKRNRAYLINLTITNKSKYLLPKNLTIA